MGKQVGILIDAEGSSAVENRSEVESGLMRRLIETDLATARQSDCSPNAPIFCFNFGTLHILGSESFDCGLEIVAHQVRQSPKQVVVGVRLRELAIARMDSHFCWRGAKNEPATSDINVAETENVAKERAVSFRIRAVEKDVKANDHGAKSSTRKNAV